MRVSLETAQPAGLEGVADVRKKTGNGGGMEFSRDLERQLFLPREAMEDLVQALLLQGYTVLGPVVRNGVVAMGPIRSAGELPRGLKDVQQPGHYRLVESEEDLYFGCGVGQDSPKRVFFPAEQRLFTYRVEAEHFVLEAGGSAPPRTALIGARPCDLAAVHIQDRVFGRFSERPEDRGETDGYYVQAREKSLLVVVNCTQPGGTCFCASMGTGPRARGGFDLALTELRNGFVVECGSEKGRELLAGLPVRDASPAEQELMELKLVRAGERMGRELETDGLVGLLDRTIEHPRWEQLARRDLSCGNCTMVCPTCFCSTMFESDDLATGTVTRSLRWESCFTHQFSYLTGGASRNTIRGRFRHWLRHKLGTWWEQFGTTGCVGCGRCITWCPAGIDLTEEVAALRAGEADREAASMRTPSGGEVKS